MLLVTVDCDKVQKNELTNCVIKYDSPISILEYLLLSSWWCLLLLLLLLLLLWLFLFHFAMFPKRYGVFLLDRVT